MSILGIWSCIKTYMCSFLCTSVRLCGERTVWLDKSYKAITVVFPFPELISRIIYYKSSVITGTLCSVLTLLTFPCLIMLPAITHQEWLTSQ